MPNIIFNIPLYFTGITTYIYTELAPKHIATYDFCSSVGRALVWRSSNKEAMKILLQQ